MATEEGKLWHHPLMKFEITASQVRQKKMIIENYVGTVMPKVGYSMDDFRKIKLKKKKKISGFILII